MSTQKLIAILFSFFLFCKTGSAAEGAVGSSAQSYYIKANIKGLSVKEIYLESVYGDDLKRIDSTVCDSNGNCQLKIDGNMPVGIYRVVLGKIHRSDRAASEEVNIDILFNHENIRFSTYFIQAIDSLIFSESESNRLYYDFYHTLKHKYLSRLDVLNQTTHYYPPIDDFYKEITAHFNKVLQEEDKYVNGFLKENANTLAARIIKFQQKPDYFKFVEATEKMADTVRNQYMKAHFWDGLDFSDTVILHTSLIPDKIMAFLSLYRDKPYTSVQQSDEYKKAVDVIISKVQGNDVINSYILTYLTKGFEKLGENEVVIYITDKYIDNSCKNDDLKSEYEDKAEKMKKVAIGQQAPEIEMNDINGKPVKLSDINTEYTVVLFWASWCEHCKTMLPQIKAAYNTINDGPKKRLEILAFSIDNDTTAWKKFVTDGNYTWINCSELKGWKSKVAQDYDVNGTPTMFLLDRNKKIIGKPAWATDLENEILR